MNQLRHAVRRLLRAPGFTLATVLTLAICIGATTAIFSVVNGILIQPLPFQQSERLVALTHRQQAGLSNLPASPAIYFTYRDHSETFESVALWLTNTASITGAGNPEEVQTLVTTHEFLPTLGVQPALGRSFTAADDQPGGPKTVILSHGYWQRRYGGAENVLGEALDVDGAPYTVIGVLPRDFRFSQRTAEILVPMQPNRSLAPVGPLGENGIARLKPGVTLADASADVDRMISIMIETFPAMPGMDMRTLTSTRLQADLRPLKDYFVRDLGEVLPVLLGTIAMLLLIACANIANLQLVRTSSRSRELAIRAALGAGTRSLAGSLLLESALLAVVGGVAGLALAAAALPVLLGVAAQNLPVVLRITIDSTVLGVWLATSLAAGLLFGSLPAARFAVPRVAIVLGGAGRAPGVTRERHRTRNALVVAQVAIALVLLVASGLMIRTYEALRDVDPGFTAPTSLQTVRISIPPAVEPSFARVLRMQNDIQDRLVGVAGVESAGFISALPLGFGPSTGLFLQDKVLPPGQGPTNREFRYVSPGFFEAFGTALIAGRTFEWRDNYEDRRVALISESLARAEWGTAEAAIGKQLRMFPTEPWYEIVGVVGDIPLEGLDQPTEAFYFPQSHLLAQFQSRNVTYVLRSERVGTPGFVEEIQSAIWSVSGSLPLASVQSMDDVYRRSLARTSLTLVLLAITASMALLLGLIGVYGVISYSLAQRTHEIGVRLALGAQTATLKRMLLGQVLLLVGVGVGLGLAGAAALSRSLRTLLFGVGELDPATYVAVAAVLIVAALLAGYLPARRVTRIDPMQALRTE
jgi:putative ABC transport system permease protein